MQGSPHLFFHLDQREKSKHFLSLAKCNGTGNNIHFDIESEYGRDNNLEWCDKMELNLIIYFVMTCNGVNSPAQQNINLFPFTAQPARH